MANSVIKTNIDKYARAIVDSSFIVHTWEDILKSGFAVDEFHETLYKGGWNDSSYILLNPFFKEEGYNYFLFPEQDSILPFGEACVYGSSINDGAILLECVNVPKEDVSVCFFRTKLPEDTEQQVSSVFSGVVSNVQVDSFDSSYSDIKNSIDSNGVAVISLSMSDVDFNACLVSRINEVSEDGLGGENFYIASNDSYTLDMNSQTYDNYVNALDYDPSENQEELGE